MHPPVLPVGKVTNHSRIRARLRKYACQSGNIVGAFAVVCSATTTHFFFEQKKIHKNTKKNHKKALKTIKKSEQQHNKSK
jgi:hypothetical protein